MQEYEIICLALRQKNKFLKLLFLIVFVCSCNNRRNEQNIGNISNKSTDAIRWEFKANQLYDQDQYSEAIKYFDSLVNLDSTKGEYYFKRGYSYGKLLMKVKAIADFRRSLNLNYNIKKSYYNLGVYNEYENDSLALENYEKCLAIDPNDKNTYQQVEEVKQRLKEQRLQPRQF